MEKLEQIKKFMLIFQCLFEDVSREGRIEGAARTAFPSLSAVTKLKIIYPAHEINTYLNMAPLRIARSRALLVSI